MILLYIEGTLFATIAMKVALFCYYNTVMEDANASRLDLGELRKRIGSINGVGESAE